MQYLVTMTTHVPDGTPDQAVEMQAILKSLPMDPWMTIETTPLSQHPSDPAMIIA